MWFFLRMCFFIAIAGVSTASMAAPQVVVSVRPLYSLVSGVMEGVATPELLIKAGVSPHDYSMKPSDMRRLQKAEVIFFSGGSLDAFLSKPLKEAHLPVVSLLSEEELPFRRCIPAAQKWEKQENSKSNETCTIDTHNTWLAPPNALAFIAAIEAELSKRDPQHQAEYRKNALQLTSQIKALDMALKKKLALYTELPFLVYHDGYRYFTDYFQLDNLGSLVSRHDEALSPKRLSRLKEALTHYQVTCVFSEAETDPALITKLTEDRPVGTAILDAETGPLHQDGSAIYVSLMHNLADHIISCLDQHSKRYSYNLP